MIQNNIIKHSLLAGVMAITLSSCETEKQITEAEIPTEINNYITTHFPNSKIIKTEYEKDVIDEKYEVTLSDNITLEFDQAKEIIDIDSSTKLPDSVIPTEIRDYVQSNFPNAHITDWELDNNEQQVVLDNNVELEFDANGKFLRVDK